MVGNAWTNHVKKFAIEHNLSYGCAMSMPQCRQSYHKPERARPSKRAKRHSRLSEEEEFYRRNPQLNIERMGGDYDY